MNIPLSGNMKSAIEAVVAAAATAGADTLLQQLSPPFLIDWRQVGVVTVVAGLGALVTSLRSLLRYPDGSTIYAAPQGSAVLTPQVTTSSSLTGLEAHVVVPVAPGSTVTTPPA